MYSPTKAVRPLQSLLTSITPATPATLLIHHRPNSTSAATSTATATSSTKFIPPPTPKAPWASRPSLQAGPVFLLLSAVGIAATSYGLWTYFTSFQTWPSEVREDLRSAVKLRNAGEVKYAESRFRRALATAQTLSPEALSPSPLLKITGISIALASMLEEAGQLDKAYVAYRDAFEYCLSSQGTVVDRPGTERARAVAISQKLGEVASRISVIGPDKSSGMDLAGTAAERALNAQPLVDADTEEAGLPSRPFSTREAAREAGERHLVWSVEELLRMTVPQEIQQAASITSAASQSGAEPVSKEGTGTAAAAAAAAAQTDSVSLADLDLPPWVTQMDLLGSIESLGSFYAREGRTEYAVPLYLQALEILIPTSSSAVRKPQESITVSDRCRAAVVMNNLSQVFLEGQKPNDEEFSKATAAAGGKEKQALQWAKKGLSLVQSTNAKVGWGLKSEGDGAGNATGVPVGRAKEVVGMDQEARVEVVKKECIRVEITLLVNLASLSQIAKDDCAARNYLQRAYRLADQEGFREARIRAASMLAGLERFKKRD